MTNSPDSITPNAHNIAQSARAAQKGGLPPVEKWNPPFCGDIDMQITRDGTWFYEGSPIGRAPLVKLFSSILWREGDKYFLVTPVEKVGIRVDDAPLFALDFEVSGSGKDQELTFETKTEDFVTASSDFPLRFSFDASGEPSPYILIRRNLEALIDRKSFYRLVDLGTTETRDGEDWFGIWSGGTFFKIMRAAELTL